MSIGYKYRANIIEENNYLRDIDSLLKDELWASSFDDLNDPFETEYIDNISRDLKVYILYLCLRRIILQAI